MRIIWIGKYNGNNLPVVDMDAGVKSLPEVPTRSILLLIPICIAFASCVYFKHKYLGGVAFSRESWMIGLVIALLFTPVHELIHAICFPANSKVYMFYTLQGFGMTCTTPVTRNRFIVVNFLPSLLLGLVPFVLFMVIPKSYVFLSTVLCVFSVVHLACGYVDHLNIAHLLKLPKNAVIQISGANIYWKQAAE